MEVKTRKKKEKKEKAEGEHTVWDYIGMINYSKIIPDFDEHFEKVYSPFVVNRFFSFVGEGNIIIINMLNRTPGLGKREHFIFLHAVIRKAKRSTKWFKQEKDDKIKILSDVYKCTVEKAKAFADLISDDQMLEIEKLIYKGGVKGTKNAEY